MQNLGALLRQVDVASGAAETVLREMLTAEQMELVFVLVKAREQYAYLRAMKALAHGLTTLDVFVDDFGLMQAAREERAVAVDAAVDVAVAELAGAGAAATGANVVSVERSIERPTRRVRTTRNAVGDVLEHLELGRSE